MSKDELFERLDRHAHSLWIAAFVVVVLIALSRFL